MSILHIGRYRHYKGKEYTVRRCDFGSVPGQALPSDATDDAAVRHRTILRREAAEVYGRKAMEDEEQLEDPCWQ